MAVTKEALEHAQVRLQEHGKQYGGYTDVEIMVPGHGYVVVEMKRGWNLPSKDQLKKYEARDGFRDPRYPKRWLLTLSECSPEYAGQEVPASSFPPGLLRHFNWKLLLQLAGVARPKCSHHQKRLLGEFIRYIRKTVTMRTIDSNWVWLVPLSDRGMENWDISFREVVEVHHRYFHPVGKGSQHEPPTYIGFHYKGRLHSVHYIEEYATTMNASPLFKQRKGGPFTELHYLYTLGPAIVPPKPVLMGSITAQSRIWCMLDTLLTCDTLSDALAETKKREKKDEAG